MPYVAYSKSHYFSHFLCYAFLLALSLSFITSCSSRRIIVNGLDQKEANEILVFLSSKNIDATRVQAVDAGGAGGAKVVMWDISVPVDQATEAMAILNQAGLPRRAGQNLLGIFSNGGLVPSEMNEKIRYQSGLGEQIANTIRKIDGILETEVQISIPEEDPLNPGGNKQKITASVYVKHSGVLDDPNAHLIAKIKRLVAASVPGLDPDNVTVIADRARFNGRTGGQEINAEEEKHFVNIWTLILAEESVSRFRIIFFSFFILILLLTLSLVWLGWKIHPLLKQHGGVKALLHPRPLGIDAKDSVAAVEGDDAAKDGEKPKKKENEIDNDTDKTT